MELKKYLEKTKLDKSIAATLVLMRLLKSHYGQKEIDLTFKQIEEEYPKEKKEAIWKMLKDDIKREEKRNG